MLMIDQLVHLTVYGLFMHLPGWRRVATSYKYHLHFIAKFSQTETINLLQVFLQYSLELNRPIVSVFIMLILY